MCDAYYLIFYSQNNLTVWVASSSFSLLFVLSIFTTSFGGEFFRVFGSWDSVILWLSLKYFLPSYLKGDNLSSRYRCPLMVKQGIFVTSDQKWIPSHDSSLSLHGKHKTMKQGRDVLLTCHFLFELWLLFSSLMAHIGHVLRNKRFKFVQIFI